MKRMIAVSLFAVLLFTGCGQKDAGNGTETSVSTVTVVEEAQDHEEAAFNMTLDYRSMLLSFDYGDEVTYVIGHKNPDADSVGCAMA